MMQKKLGFFILLISVLLIKVAQAQDTVRIDSLNNKIPKAPAQELYRLFETLGKSLDSMDFPSAIRTANRSLERARGNVLATILAHRNLGNIYNGSGDKATALDHYQAALTIAQENPAQEFGLATAHFQLGQFLNQQGLLSQGLQHILDASQIFESLRLYKEVILCHYEACTIQFNARNFQQCIQEGYQVLAFHEKLNPSERTTDSEFQKMSTYNTIALANRDLKQYDMAMINYDKAEAIARKIHNDFWIGLINGNKAVVLKDLGREDEAIASLLADYQTSRKFKVWNSAGMSALSLAEIYSESDFKKAHAFLDSAKHMFSREKDFVSVRKGMSSYWKSFSKVMNAERDFKEAYLALNRHVNLRDSLYQEQEALNIAKVKATYDLEHKQTEIELLTKNNEIQQERIRGQNTLFIATLIGLILLVVLVISLVFNFRRQQHISKLVRQQRDEIEAKNSALEDQSMKLQESNQHIQALNTQLEQKVAERTRELEVTNKELDTFLYRSSHDIRRPITTLLGLDQVARHVINDSQANLLFDKVVETARNMDSMLFKMQMMYELNKPDLPLEPVNISQMIEDLAGYFRSDFEKYTITSNLTIPQNLSILSNGALLLIIFRNIVENSILFRKTQPGAIPFIDITVTQQLETIEIVVADNGIGVEEKYQPQVFDLYFRASQASKGNGLGLYLVKKAVQKLNGKIQLMSDYGMGTTFTLILPIIQ